MKEVGRKIQDVRKTLEGISSDISELLSMAEISIPIAENVIDRVKERFCQIEKLFASGSGEKK
jgi:hypothetical protein